MTTSNETSLLAILLVASSPRLGPQVLFSYPTFPNPLPRLNKPVYPASTDKRTRQRLYHQRAKRNLVQRQKDQGELSSESDSQPSDSDAASEHPWYTRSETSSTSSEDENDPSDDSPTRDASLGTQRNKGTEYTHFLGIQNSVLASSLIPSRKELRDTKLELVIDHLSFIGHPVHLDRGREKRAKAVYEEEQQAQQKHQRQRSSYGSKDFAALNSPRPAAFASPMLKAGGPAAVASSRQNSPSLHPAQDTGHVMPMTPMLQARSLAQVSHNGQGHAAAAGNKLESDSVSSNSPLPPGNGMSSSIASLGDMRLPPPASIHEDAAAADPSDPPLLDAAATQAETRRRSVSAHSTSKSSQALEAFNIVLVIDTPPDRHLSNHLQVYYQDIVLKLTAAVKYEELRDGWLSAEAATALKVKEDAKDQERPLSSCIEGLVHCSSLCAALADAFEAISNRKVARLTSLNHHIDIQLIVHDEVFDRNHVPPNFAQPSPGISASTSAVLRPPTDATRTNLAPHQTLIPLEDPATILHELERSPPSDLPLTQFLEIMTPSLNFQEYAALLDVDLVALQAMAQHLIYWRKARLSNVVSLRNIYRPTEQLDLSRLPVVAETYGRKFSTLPPLISVLARLREARPFVEALQIPASQSRRSAYLEMLVWLLSQKLVVELRVFYRLVANTEIKWRATQGEPSRLQTRVSSDDVAGSAPGPLAASKGHSASLTDSPTSSQFLSTPLESPARPNTFTHRQSSALSGISEDQLQNTTTSTASPVPIPGQMPRQTSGVSGMSGPTSPSFHSHDGPTSASSSSFNETSIISEPGEASHVERMWLQKMTEGRPPDIVTGFQRVAPFLNGRHDWEEILFRSGLARRQLKRVFEEIGEHLIVFYN